MSAPTPGRLFINGRWEEAASGQTIDVYNPATGQLVTTVADGASDDIDRAVKAARESFESRSWRGLDASARERILWRIGDLLEARADRIARLIVEENGKTLREAVRADVMPAADAFRYYAGWVRKLYGETIPVDGEYLNYTLREPVGVVGAIVPWNFPLQLAAWKVAPALACGCSVVLKPSELTPLDALELADVCREAGLPAGALNVVTGYGETAGEALALHHDVDKISFTGGAATGRRLLQAAAASNLKGVTLELGGKSPLLVFPDCDLDAVVRAAIRGVFLGKGEVCSAASCLLVHADVYDRVCGEVAARASRLKVGDPLASTTQMGSQISGRQMDRILDYIQSGRDEGAKLLCGGARDTEGAKARGFFVQPTVFSEVRPEMKIAREEIFGPVLAAIRFRDAAEAVAIANGTTYGLAASVWTCDLTTAHRVARELRTGSVWVNTYNAFDSASPFGGYKQSGFGRDLGAQALEQYTQVKSVWVAL